MARAGISAVYIAQDGNGNVIVRSAQLADDSLNEHVEPSLDTADLIVVAEPGDAFADAPGGGEVLIRNVPSNAAATQAQSINGVWAAQTNPPYTVAT